MGWRVIVRRRRWWLIIAGVLLALVALELGLGRPAERLLLSALVRGAPEVKLMAIEGLTGLRFPKGSVLVDSAILGRPGIIKAKVEINRDEVQTFLRGLPQPHRVSSERKTLWFPVRPLPHPSWRLGWWDASESESFVVVDFGGSPASDGPAGAPRPRPDMSLLIASDRGPQPIVYVFWADPVAFAPH
jgi:hypothetical protein